MSETLGFTVKVDGIEKGISNLKEYKLAIKQAKDEQVKAALAFGETSDEFQKASKKLADLQDRLEGLGDTTRNVKGDGIEPLESSMSTLRDGLGKGDWEKFKTGLKGIGGAMSAIPVFLLIQGLNLLVENFDEVVAFGKELFDTFDADAKAVKRLSSEVEYQKTVTADLSKEIERELQVMEASGASHDKILAKKKELIQTQIDEAVAVARLNIAKAQEVMNNDTLYEGYLRLTAAAQRKIGADKAAEATELLIAINKKERNEENIKAINDSIQLIKDLKTKSQVEDIKFNKEEALNWKKLQDDKKAEAEKLAEYNKNRQKMEADSEVAAEQYLVDQKRIATEQKMAYDQQEADAKASLLNDSIVRAEAEAQEDLKNHEKIQNAKQQIVSSGIEATAALTELVGDIALNRAKGNAEKEIKIRKAMFQVDKAFNVARAVQDGIRSVQAALTIPPPFGQILAGINAGAAAINIGKILATKFDGGSIPSVDTGTAGGGGSISNAASNVNTTVPSLPQNNQSTSFDENGRNMNIKAEVVETENRAKTKLIDKYNKQAEY
jgi:hypothetical protein